jgi:hypothetical protein
MYCNKTMEWQWLPLQMLLDHYELKDGQPTHGELLLDAHLASIGNGSQLPLSDNLHSVFNKRHYITYGGFLSGNNLVKPPWVRVQQTGNERSDRCTLCKSSKTAGMVWCNDGHLQSTQHTTNVVEWFRHYEFRCWLHSGARAAGASTPSSRAAASTVAPALQVPHVTYVSVDVGQGIPMHGSQEVGASAAACTDPAANGDSWGMEWRSPPPQPSDGGMSMIDHLSAQAPVLLREAEDDLTVSGRGC